MLPSEPLLISILVVQPLRPLIVETGSTPLRPLPLILLMMENAVQNPILLLALLRRVLVQLVVFLVLGLGLLSASGSKLLVLLLQLLELFQALLLGLLGFLGLVLLELLLLLGVLFGGLLLFFGEFFFFFLAGFLGFVRVVFGLLVVLFGVVLGLLFALFQEFLLFLLR